MPYALFSNAVKVSKAFHNKSDVWAYASASGLVIELRSSEEDPPRRTLAMGCTIRDCEPESTRASEASAGLSEKELAQLIAATAINPRSATAAS